MKIFLKQVIYVLAIIFSLTACDKDEDFIENSENVNAKYSSRESESSEIDNKLHEYTMQYNGEYVEANFIGRIIDENDEPIKGARITLGEQEKETDQNGIVLFSDAKVQQYFAHVRAFADGYLDGSRVMVPNFDDGNQNNFTIKLFKFNEVASIDSEKGGEVSFDSGIGEGFLSFNPGFTDESGNQYHGDIAVSINYLDPLNPDTANTMPGDLYGITQDFEQVALGSYGMIQVELRGDSGEKLQIIDPAKLRMPIHPDQIATATNEVPMWSFNEYAGVWYEETIAHRDGNHYVTEVPHFSFWNCDAPFPVVNFSATVIDATSSNPLSGLSVEIIYNGFSRFAITDASGIVSGKLPANQMMTLKIVDSCGNIIHFDSSFGPFTTSTSITIPVTVTPTQAFSLSGTVQDCSTLPITNGYVTLSYFPSGQYITTIPVSTGSYTYAGVGCNLPSGITITGGNFSNGQSSTTTTTVVAGPNIQNIVICGGLANEYIRYRISPTGPPTGPYHYDLVNPAGGIRGGTSAYVEAFSNTRQTYIFSDTVALGTYPIGFGLGTMYMESLSDINGIDVNATMALPATGRLSFTLTSITLGPGGITTYINISFSGNYVTNVGATTQYIEGEAHIRRDQ